MSAAHRYTFTVWTVGACGMRYVGEVDGLGSSMADARVDAGITADEQFGRSCPGGLELVCCAVEKRDPDGAWRCTNVEAAQKVA